MLVEYIGKPRWAFVEPSIGSTTASRGSWPWWEPDSSESMANPASPRTCNDGTVGGDVEPILTLPFAVRTPVVELVES